jgi:hypothetical protein
MVEETRPTLVVSEPMAGGWSLAKMSEAAHESLGPHRE